jgi:hypothetical protein
MIFVKKIIWWLLISLNGVKYHRTSVGIPSWGSAVLTPTLHSLTHAVFSPLGRLVCLLMPEKVITFICSL